MQAKPKLIRELYQGADCLLGRVWDEFRFIFLDKLIEGGVSQVK